MKNLPFVLWMLGYPLVIIMEKHLRKDNKDNDSVSEEAKLLAAIANIVAWICIGHMIYEK